MPGLARDALNQAYVPPRAGLMRDAYPLPTCTADASRPLTAPQMLRGHVWCSVLTALEPSLLVLHRRCITKALHCMLHSSRQTALLRQFPALLDIQLCAGSNSQVDLLHAEPGRYETQACKHHGTRRYHARPSSPAGQAVTVLVISYPTDRSCTRVYPEPAHATMRRVLSSTRTGREAADGVSFRTSRVRMTCVPEAGCRAGAAKAWRGRPVPAQTRDSQAAPSHHGFSEAAWFGPLLFPFECTLADSCLAQLTPACMPLA